MPDNLNDSGPQDGKHVSLTQLHEVRYWTKEFNRTLPEINAACRHLGTRTVSKLRAHFALEDVEREAAKQSDPGDETDAARRE